MKDKRKPRTKVSKGFDILNTPIVSGVNVIGTEGDCFGRLNDPRAEECNRCGDAEICAAVQGQSLHALRKNIEADKKFMDLEDENTNGVDKKVIKKKIRNRIRELIKIAGDKGILMTKVIDDLYASYFNYGFTKEKLQKMLESQISNTDLFSYAKKTNRLKWNK